MPPDITGRGDVSKGRRGSWLGGPAQLGLSVCRLPGADVTASTPASGTYFSGLQTRLMTYAVMSALTSTLPGTAAGWLWRFAAARR